MTRDEQIRMFGEPDWVEQMDERMQSGVGGMKIFAMGILSDAQEVLAGINPQNPHHGAETARQYINKAKHIMCNHMVTAMHDLEKDALLIAIDHCATDETKDRLRWLMDPRR